MLAVVLLLVGCGPIEGYVSPDPLMPLPARLVIGVGYFVLMVTLLRGGLFRRRRARRTELDSDAAAPRSCSCGHAAPRPRDPTRRPAPPAHRAVAAMPPGAARAALSASRGRDRDPCIAIVAGLAPRAQASWPWIPATSARCSGDSRRIARQQRMQRRILDVGQQHPPMPHQLARGMIAAATGRTRFGSVASDASRSRMRTARAPRSGAQAARRPVGP